MDYKELMCGDLVKVEQTTEVVNAKVLGVYKDGINYEVDYSGVRATNQIHTDYVSPIELTEDILVKNGFKKVNEHYECIVDKQLAGDGFEVQQIIIHSNNAVTIYTCIARILIHIDYVHQLQHLLRLCGIEKELTI